MTRASTFTSSVSITATNSTFSDTASVNVTPAPATVVLSHLNQTYDGNPKPVTVTTTPASLANTVTYNTLSTVPSSPGTYAVEANIIDPNYQGSASASLVIKPAKDLASWKNSYFTSTEQAAGLADNLADPDFDNQTNLMEYALGTHPRHFSPTLTPVLDSNGLTLTFTRPTNLPDVTYSAQSTNTFGSWSLIPLEIITPGDPETVRARDPLTTGDPSKRFMRLRITTP